MDHDCILFKQNTKYLVQIDLYCKSPELGHDKTDGKNCICAPNPVTIQQEFPWKRLK